MKLMLDLQCFMFSFDVWGPFIPRLLKSIGDEMKETCYWPTSELGHWANSLSPPSRQSRCKIGIIWVHLLPIKICTLRVSTSTSMQWWEQMQMLQAAEADSRRPFPRLPSELRLLEAPAFAWGQHGADLHKWDHGNGNAFWKWWSASGTWGWRSAPPWACSRLSKRKSYAWQDWQPITTTWIPALNFTPRSQRPGNMR